MTEVLISRGSWDGDTAVMVIWVLSSEVHVLKAWSSRWCHWEVMEQLEGRVLSHWGMPIRDCGTLSPVPSSASCSLMQRVLCRASVLLHGHANAQTHGAVQSWIEISKSVSYLFSL